MGLEVEDGSGGAMAGVSGLEDPGVKDCELFDLGGNEDIAHSNGHLAEEEALSLGQHEGAPAEQVFEGDIAETVVQEVSGSQSHTKKWSDFNAVSSKTFGEQGMFGSFSDFLADYPSELPPQAAGLPQAVSDIGFFEWVANEPDASLGGIGLSAVTPQAEPVGAAVVEDASPRREEQAPPSEVVASETNLSFETQVYQNLPLEQRAEVQQTWSDLPAEQGQSLVAEAEVTQSADPYPGWYYDYQASEWRQVEADASVATFAGATSTSQEVDESLKNASDASASTHFEWATTNVDRVSSGQSVEEAEAWGTQSAATQTTIDDYPGWTWDYTAQTWVQVPGYTESWQDTTGQAQSGQQSWYAQQEQQLHEYIHQPHMATINEQQDPAIQQPQAFYPGYTAEIMAGANTGYTPESGNVSSAGSAYEQEVKQWQGGSQHSTAMAAGTPEVFTPHMNGGQGWSVSTFNTQDASTFQSMPSNTYVPSNPYPTMDPYNSYPVNTMQNTYEQLTWGSTQKYNQYPKFTNPTAPPPKNVQEAMRTCVGRPPHSLATFGFGGKLMFLKLRDPVTLHTSNGDQAVASGEAWMPGPVQVLNLSTYLSKEESFAGPLMGGACSTKELNKWIDESISRSPAYDSVRMLLGLLKVSCQHYGKLRSPNVNTGNSSVDEGGPEAALAKLLAGSGEEQGLHSGGSYRSTLALQGMCSEQLLQATALEVKKLLVAGKRKEALKCAQIGELWGIALILARQLGEKFYSDTVMEMARRQFVAGCPLRTLSLLLAGQPAEVFALPPSQTGNPMDGTSAGSDSTQDGIGAMLNEWQENLAIMAANCTPGDERVILHLGDQLWRVRGEVAAAHLCYLVADANIECYSGNARICLIGADHCKYPRTFATPEAIKRTEIYEYAKLLGNPQYVLLSFQPYKLVYAEMLAEAGKVAEAFRYCQIVLKTLKTAGRTPDVEACRIVATNLEERLRNCMQDGHGSKLAPGRIVGRFLGTLDWGISKMIGGPPPSAAASDPFAYKPLDNGGNQYDSTTLHSDAVSGQRAGTPLAPSASIAASMERLPHDPPNRGPYRSQSEPDFGRNTKQGDAEVNSSSSPRAGMSRLGLGRFGSSLFEKMWGPPKNKAKLGEANKFYYDEKLKKWVEEGVEPTPEPALPPPPPTSTYSGPSPQEENHAPPSAVTLKPGTPPIVPSTNNQFSNRRQGGVRSRYVDTFNKGGSTTPSNSILPSLIPPSRSGGGPSSMPAMFVPAPVPASSYRESNDEMGDNFTNEALRDGVGPALDITYSDVTMDTARTIDQPPSFMTPSAMVPPVSTSEDSRAFWTAESTDRSSLGGPPAFGGVHTRAASWSGYPSTFQNSQFSGEEDSYRASFSGSSVVTGSEHVPHMDSLSGSPPTFSNFYMPNTGGENASLPPPPLLAVPSAALGTEGNGGAHMRDPITNIMGQQSNGSLSVDSLAGEDMQEVEL